MMSAFHDVDDDGGGDDDDCHEVVVVLLCSMFCKCWRSRAQRPQLLRSTINAAGDLSIPAFQHGRTLAKCHDFESLLVTL